VVCLLGLDDGVFPRGARIDGDDILARAPRVGERDPRSEDRQLFLDAILAAQDRLVVVYTGADERTGAERPPAVPLGELLDVLDRTARVPTGCVRDRVLVRHPLQPFDPRNFEPAALTGPRGFSFDTAAYDGSRALLGDRRPRPAFLPEPLPEPQETEPVALDALIRFLEHPVRQFLRQRLGLSSADEQEQPDEAIPVAPGPLELWEVGDRLLAAGLADVPADRAVRAEWLRGQLPPGRLGSAVLDPVVRDVALLVDRTGGLRGEEPTSLDVAIDLDSGESVVGTVPGVRGDCVLRVVYSRLGAKHRLRAWVQLLALAAQWPQLEWQAKTVGRGPRDGVAMSHLTGVNAQDARRHLEGLVEMYRAGLCRPLPLPPKSAAAYAEKRRTNAPVRVALAQAGKQWRSGSGPNERGEFSDADFQQVFGDVPLTALLAEAADRTDADWPDEPSRFGQLARRVWQPLLDAEAVH
jgi:exodeoxyribonuclease V gamma subunit